MPVKGCAMRVRGDRRASADLNAEHNERSGRWVLWIGFALLCGVAIGIAGRELDRPGLYYDEIIQVEPSVRFLTADPSPHAIPGASQIRVASRWFPVMTQPYMGALKSQLLIPFLAIFGTSPASLRLTTLAWSLVGVLLMMSWARNALGLSVALIAGALVVLDPNFLLVSRHDWGSFGLGFVFRCGALLLITQAFRQRGVGGLKLVAGGALLGLGIYNKIDFGVALIAAVLALLAVRPRLPAEILASPRRAILIVLGAVLGAAPILASLPQTLATTRKALARSAGVSDFDEKWNTLVAMFDGSYFHELMLSGGVFKEMFETDGTGSLFPILFGLSLLWVATGTWRGLRSGEPHRTRAFVALCSVLIPLGVLLTPRAIRIHHALLAVPFPQLLVAIAAVDVWNTTPKTTTARHWMRAVAVLGVATAIFGSLRVDLATLGTIHETRGRGRWSDAIGRFSADLRSHDATPTAVSLDWGLYLPLRFADRSLTLIEPIWQLGAQLGAQRPWTFEGSERHVYLLFEPQFAVFRYGQQFLEAVARLPEDRVEIRHHSDASGDPVFVSVRLLGPHRLRYTGRFQIEWSPIGDPLASSGDQSGEAAEVGEARPGFIVGFAPTNR
ncbi:MAG: glycosyltransferase family 39 protein [Myxococcota bacterium]